jgi:hypothetical protein
MSERIIPTDSSVAGGWHRTLGDRIMEQERTGSNGG